MPTDRLTITGVPTVPVRISAGADDAVLAVAPFGADPDAAYEDRVIHEVTRAFEEDVAEQAYLDLRTARPPITVAEAPARFEAFCEARAEQRSRQRADRCAGCGQPFRPVTPFDDRCPTCQEGR